MKLIISISNNKIQKKKKTSNIFLSRLIEKFIIYFAKPDDVSKKNYFPFECWRGAIARNIFSYDSRSPTDKIGYNSIGRKGSGK